VTITASSGGSSQNALLTINSSNPCVEGLQLTANITNLLTGEGVLNGLVTLTGPAPAGGANVPLLIGNTQIGQVFILPNQSTGSFNITLANLNTLLGSVVRAVFGPCGVNATISLNVPILGSLNLPVNLTLGQSGTGSVTLSQAAPLGGAVVQLSQTPLGIVGSLLNGLLGAVVIPSQVTVPAGQTSATFPVTSGVLSGVLNLLMPNQVTMQVNAVLQTAFTPCSQSGTYTVSK
jgi:hypothetical protein